MALPAGYEERTREEWLSLASDSDALKRKIVTNCIRELGKQPTDYMTWDVNKRVDFIMEHQEPAMPAATEPKGKTKGKASESTATETTSTKAAGTAAVAGLDPATKKAIEEVREESAENKAMLRKVHNLLVILCLSTPAAKSNAEEFDVELNLLGND